MKNSKVVGSLGTFLGSLLGQYVLGALLLSQGTCAPLAYSLTHEQASNLAEGAAYAAAELLYLFTERCIFFREECGVDGSESRILRTGFIEQKTMGPVKLQFASEAASPGTFMIDGQVRVAKTGSHAGDAIILNRDLLAVADASGEFVPAKLSEIVGILAHELGHHYDDIAARIGFETGLVSSHELLDVIGAKVRAFAESRRQMAFVGEEIDPLLAGENGIAFENYIFEAGRGDGDYNYGSVSRTFVRGPFGYVDVTSQIANLTRCPHKTIDGVGSRGVPLNLYFENFEKMDAIKHGNVISLRLKLSDDSYLSCGVDPMDWFKGYEGGILDLSFIVNGGSLSFSPSDMRLKITVPPDVDWHSTSQPR